MQMGAPQDQSDSSPSPAGASGPGGDKKKAGRELDLSVLDEESIIIMLELMMCLDETNMPVEKFFEDICYD